MATKRSHDEAGLCDDEGLVMKRVHDADDADTQLPANDGMLLLRREIQGIWNTFSKHEDRAAALRQIHIRNVARSSSRSGELVPQRPYDTVIRHPYIEPKLQKLPVELIETIASFLDKRSFMELRYTGRAMRDGSSHGFLRRFFETRTAVLGWESLRRLAVVVAQPNLRGAVKHLVFLVENEVVFLGEQGGDEAMGIPVSEGWRPDTCPKAKSWLYLLDRVFTNLSGVKGVSFRAKQGYAMSSHAIALVLAAVAGSGLKVGGLSLGGEDAERCGDFCDYRGRVATLLKQERAALGRCFQGMKRLEMFWYAEDDVPECSMTKGLLPLTPNLETLVVWEVDGVQRFDYLNSFRSSLPKLKKLELHYPCIEKTGRYARCVVGFVKKWAKGVKKIEVRLSGRAKVRDGERFAGLVRGHLDGVVVEVRGGRASSVVATVEDGEEVSEQEGEL